MKQVNSKIPFRMLSLLLGLILTVGAFAQQIAVKGHVKDAAGEPIIGATVRVAGTQAGTVTDFDGNFTIKANPGVTLTISYVGYQTASVKATASVLVTLQEDATVLENVVVIGYGVAKKNDLTGAVTAIKPDELTKGITTSAQDMLTGKVAGVNITSQGGTPGGGATIRIRGGSSLSATNDPLIVIDGLAMDNSGVQGLGNALAMVNPEDIESFTVLKDASATAIYGSRASNGVIIITTKKGVKGAKGAPRVSYNGNVSVSMKRNSYDVLTGDQYRDYVINTLGESGAGLGEANTDWQDEVYRTAISTDHQLSVTGAALNTPYRISAGYTDQNGIAKTSNFQRFTGSVNLSPSFFKDHLTLNVNAKYMYSKYRYVDGAVFGAAIAMDPTQPVYADSYATGGYWQTVIADPSKENWNTPITNTKTPQNPVALMNLKNDRAHSTVWIGGIEADYKIHGLEDLHIHAKLSADYSEGQQETDISPYSCSNNYYGYSGVQQSYKYNILGNVYAQYLRDFGKNHHLDIMAGAEQQHFHRSKFNYGGGNYLGDQLVEDPANYKSPQVRSQTERLYRSSLVSYFGRFNYNLADRYLLTATVRADGSSRFADGNRWGYFPSVGLAWKVKEESFLKNANALDDLKVRVGWGITGQQEMPEGYEFYYSPRYVISNEYAQYPLGNQNYYTKRPEVFNDDLTWEKTATWNAGLDWSFFNRRIEGSLDYYYRKTTDLLSFVSVASGTGFGNYKMMNVGSLRNYGVEFSLTLRPVVTKDFRWEVNYNATWNDNEITKLTGNGMMETGEKISVGLTNKVQVNKVGYPANSFYVYQQVYDEAGKPMEGVFVDRNGDGQINADDKYVYKKPTADVTMAMTQKFIYKNWDFSFTLRASLNNYLYYDFLSGKANSSFAGLYSNSAYSNTTLEAIALGFTGKTDYALSDYFVRNASFLRCDNINLGYSFEQLFKSGNYNGLSGRVYVTVQNPFVITKYDGLDPEVHQGVDNGVYPRPTTFLLGLNLNF